MQTSSVTKAAIGLAALLAVAAPGIAQAQKLVVARSVDADSLDPQKTSNTQSLQVTNLIYDTLLTMAKDGSVHPGVAQSWSVSADGKSYGFVIRDGLKCHDGTPFDAAAAKFSIDRALDAKTGNPNKSGFGPITGTAVSGSTLTLTLSEPFGPLPSFLTGIQSSLVCPSAVSGDSFKPIGTGPFKVVGWTRNDRISLAANEDYKNVNPMVANPGAPHVKALEIAVIPEAVARMAALRSGEVQMAEPSLEEAADLGKDPAFKVYEANLSGQQAFVAFTWKIKPLDNPDVRRAIAMALNRDAYAEIGFNGLVKIGECPQAPNLFASDQALCAGWGVKYDPDAAKALLAKAGYGPEHPLKVTLAVHKLPGWDQMHQIMQQDLAAIGVEAEIDTREVAAFFDHMKGENQRTDGKPVVWTMGFSGVDPDYLSLVWKRPGFVNMGVNAELDAMLDEQRRLSGDARAEKLHAIDKYLLENTYAVPLVSPGWGWLMASSAKVEGFQLGYMVSMLFNDVTVK
ncbi:ABC transporter substrate-binding protein [Labrys wisconsinensis]|uniref:ABC-type transport system substrate-binding protein n=1 Tax=Labrys wisconsinensis TaxID=425677 RepID=A0ABU0J0R4_9HYPH|nr:ABC transporter substrate-binding protein [Labrys wisconsinensis]MDQ0467023.1 ABC-type transport system substrate-binding protein [Labrys wisconsinensis]